MRQFFGGDAGSIDDFDEFITILEGGSDKAFRKMFREIGKQTRVRNQPKNARKAALSKGNVGGKRQKQMEKDMMEFMGLSMGMPMMPGGPNKKTAGKKRKKGGLFDEFDYDDEDDDMMDDMLMAMMMEGMMPPGVGKGKGKGKGKGSNKMPSEQEIFE